MTKKEVRNTMAHIIDGKAHAARLRGEIAQAVSQLKAQHNLTPGLAVVLVGEDPASQVYVRNKKNACLEAGMQSFDYVLPAATSQTELLNLIAELNANPEVHGILVQLPVPKQIDAQAVINAIDPAKDVDGFHPVNAGKLAVGQTGLVPCTPLGCLLLLRDYYRSIGETMAGKHAVVLGRSNIVGKPVAQLLLQEDCTVTICHSKTEYLIGEIRRGDILIAAIGKPEFVKGHMLKPKAVVIDVGINRVVREDGISKLVGDVDYAQATMHIPEAPGASAITPVPGGVGPMTIACLLRNTVQAACAMHGVAMPL
jgi:methylenetetrahydrofolate dehydrogenase (NADP+)/methenyltetrahydrofolate cyclohydrolase